MMLLVVSAKCFLIIWTSLFRRFETAFVYFDVYYRWHVRMIRGQCYFIGRASVIVPT